jgi:hypothetical protein
MLFPPFALFADGQRQSRPFPNHGAGIRPPPRLGWQGSNSEKNAKKEASLLGRRRGKARSAGREMRQYLAQSGILGKQSPLSRKY